VKKLLLSAAAAACFVFSSAPSFAQWVNVTGGINYPSIIVNGVETIRKVGIGSPTPNGWLQFNNIHDTRKIVLFEAADNDNQHYGIGTNLDVFRFQIPGPTRAFRFFRGNDAATSTEIFTIEGGGNVGVGISDPIVKFQVQGGNVAQVSSGALGDPLGKWSALGQPPSAFPTGGEYFGLFRNWAQQSFITGLLDNGTKKDGVIAWGDATSTTTSPGPSSTTTKLRIGFIKGSGTGTTNPAEFSEKLTIQANGFVGIGLTSPTFRIQLPNNSNSSGQGQANAWITYSSGRWKDNVKTLAKASDKIMALRGVEYDWKKENGGGHALGFIAEEVGKVLPDAVSWEEDGKSISGMNYDAVIPVLVEAFKELSKEKDAKIKALENRLAKMEESSASGRLGVSDGISASKTSAILRQNRPNPFGEKTIIEYVLPETTTQATLFIYNVQGEQIKRFEIADKHSKSLELNGNTLPAGLYLYSLLVDGKVVDTKQMVLTK